ncbi:MAG: hypothetical protein ACJA1C_000983 [Crocinitomicaceae bacterium]|jgi:hypothetical protein
MKPFLVLEEITSISFSKTSQTTLEYVPSFPGIYIDLDTSVIPDDCDHFLGETGLGSEFYLKNDRISKMFIELLPYQSVEIMDGKFNNFINETVLSDTTICELKVSALKKNNHFPTGICPSKIWIDLDLDSAFIAFEHYELDPKIKTVKTLRDVEFVAIDDNVTLGFNPKTNGLSAAFVKDFTNVFEHNGIDLTKEKTDKYRIASLKNISYRFFKEQNSKSYSDLIKHHKSSFRTQIIDKELKVAEDKILQSLQNDHEGLNKLFNPDQQDS